MEKNYKNLLSPFRIGDVVMKNRLISTNASPHFLQGPETYPADPVMTFVRNIARSGASIIMFAEWANPAQRTTGVPDMIRMQNFDLSDPSTHNYLSQMAEDVHYYDSKLCVSLIHAMPHGFVFSPAGEPPKNLRLRPGENYHGAIMQMGTEAKNPEVLPAERMQEAITPLVEKLKFYKELGYDMVALDSRPIISAYNNLRTDEYGGSFENRCRFLVETCEAIKAAVGQNFLILIFCDAWKGGYTPEEAAVMAKLLENKADILMFRKGDASTYNINAESYRELLKYTKAVKQSGAKIAVCLNSSAMDVGTNDRIIAEGGADFIGMGRGFICENQYVQKAQEGRPEDIAPCLLCNKCHGNMHAPWISYCSINPTVGLAHKIDRMVVPVTRKKRVAVIGGGPAGMEAAIYTAQRGHQVVLYEQATVLGGQLIHGDYASFKWPIKRFKEYLITQLDKQGVEVRLGLQATPEEIRQEEFDAVIAATGSSPSLPELEGTKETKYRFCIDVFGHEAEMGKRVVVVGGSETGVETAMYLAETGHEVTVLTRQNVVAHNASPLHSITAVDTTPILGGEIVTPGWVLYDNLTCITEATTRRIANGSVTYEDAMGEHVLACDDIVICGGVHPEQKAALAFADCANEFHMIGDCRTPGSIQKCVRMAFAAASQI